MHVPVFKPSLICHDARQDAAICMSLSARGCPQQAAQSDLDPRSRQAGCHRRPGCPADLVQTSPPSPLRLPARLHRVAGLGALGRGELADGRRSTGRTASADPLSSGASAEAPQAAASAGTAAELQARVASGAAAGPSGREGTVFATNDFSFVVPADFVDKQPPPPPSSGFGAPVRSTLSAPQPSPTASVSAQPAARGCSPASRSRTHTLFWCHEYRELRFPSGMPDGSSM